MKINYIEKEKQYLMPTYARYPLVVKKAIGATVMAEDGKEYIDFSSGIGVVSLGHTDKGINKAIKKQISSALHASNLYYTKPMITLAELLCEKTGMSKVFFANSGAEANECAIKLARKYSFDKYGNDRNEIITLKDSFHGRTLTTISATGQDVFHNYFFPFTQGFVFAQPNEVKDKITEKTCAVMIEFIRGEGGVILIEEETVKGISEICAQKDILLIADEVQTGVCRTGKFLAADIFGIKPDVVTLAKGLGGGLPIGATLCSEKLSDTLNAGTHGSTFGGNPVSCAAACEVMKRVCCEEFENSVTEKGEYIKAAISKINGILNVRGRGLMIAFDVNGQSGKDIVKKLLEKGLMALTAKESIRLLPPLTISYCEIDKGIKIIKEALS